jgi:hypothetical protein
MSSEAPKMSLSSKVDSHVSILGEIIDSLSHNHHDFPNKSQLPFNNQQQKVLIGSWRSLLGVELPELISVIEELPLIPILPDSENLRVLVAQHRQTSEAKTVWLRAMLLDRAADINSGREIKDLENVASFEDLKFTSTKFIPSSSNQPEFFSSLPMEVLDRGFPLAVISKLVLDLARETYPRSHDLKILFPSAEVLWICCEFSLCRFTSRVTGITGKPVIRSKRQITNYNSEFAENFENSDMDEQGKVAAANLTIIDQSEHLADPLFNEAARLRHQSTSYNDVFYENFFRIFSRINNIVRNNSGYQVSYTLPDDRMFRTGQNNKIPRDFAAPKWSKTSSHEGSL